MRALSGEADGATCRPGSPRVTSLFASGTPPSNIQSRTRQFQGNEALKCWISRRSASRPRPGCVEDMRVRLIRTSAASATFLTVQRKSAVCCSRASTPRRQIRDLELQTTIFGMHVLTNLIGDMDDRPLLQAELLGACRPIPSQRRPAGAARPLGELQADMAILDKPHRSRETGVVGDENRFFVARAERFQAAQPAVREHL